MKIKKTKRYKAHSLIILMLLIVLLTPVFVSSAEFDNIKFFDEKVGNYGKVTIRDWFGLLKLAELELKKNTDVCGVDCSAETEIIMYQDGILIDGVKFIGAEVKDYQFYIQTGEIGTGEYNDVYELVCDGDKINNSCEYKITSQEEIKTPVWEKYNLGEEVIAGTYNIKLEGTKDFYSSTDWVITSQGKELTEWADWGAGGTITYDGTDVIHTYLTDGYFNVTTTNNVEVLIVAGGGGGGASSGGGGGAGGVIHQNISVSAGNWSIIIGAGGINENSNGTNSSAFGYSAMGGGVGGSSSTPTSCIGSKGGSGGGACSWDSLFGNITGGVAIPEQGQTGGFAIALDGEDYVTAGGGGATGKGEDITGTGGSGVGGDGGAGYTTNINGTSFCWAGGGGGGAYNGGASSGGTAGCHGGDGSLIYGAGVTAGANSGGGGGGGNSAGAGGSGIVILRYSNPSLTTTLNSPIDYYNSTSNAIAFNCSASSNNLIGVIQLWFNITGSWVLNETSIGGDTIHSINFTKNIPEGNHQWTCWANDTGGLSAWATNRTFSVDATPPIITINSPTGNLNYGYLNKQENLSWSVTDTSLQSIWFNYNGTNTTLNGAVNSTTFTLASSPFNLTLYANDTIGNTNSSYRAWTYTLFGNSVNYSASTDATSNENFIINLTYISSDWISASAKLNYNGTEYIPTKTETTNNLIFNNTILVPNPSAITNYTFFWNISLTNVTGTYYIATNILSQEVKTLQIINVTSSDCPAGFSASFNFTSLIEENLTAINFGNINYNLLYGSSGNSSALVASGTFTDVSNFSICINSSSSYYVGYGEIQYEVSGYSNRRFYIFENTRLTNSTISNNLYSLETADSTAFQITATDTTLEPYNGYYITLLRWYPALNTYKIVDMGKTDEKGQTVVNVKTNDVDYRLGLYEPDGTLVKLLEPIRMVCQTTPCVYSLIVDLVETDLTTFLNVESSLTWDPTTGIFTYIFNDPSQETTLMNLTVWQDFPERNSVIICSTSSTDFTGVLVCDVSAYSGQLRAEVWREASPRIMIAQLLSSVRDSLKDIAGGKTISLLLGFILIVTFALMGVVSPVLMVVLGVVGLIPLIALGVLDKATFLIIGCIAGIVLHFMRRIV